MPADDDDRPPYEVLAALVVSLRDGLGQARERIAELEARLRQTPRNSSRPPSSEGLDKPAPRSPRKKTGAGLVVGKATRAGPWRRWRGRTGR